MWMDNKVPDKRVITFQADETRKEVGSDTQTEQQTRLNQTLDPFALTLR